MALSTSNRETLKHFEEQESEISRLECPHASTEAKPPAVPSLRAAFLGSGLTAHTGTEKKGETRLGGGNEMATQTSLPSFVI